MLLKCIKMAASLDLMRNLSTWLDLIKISVIEKH